MLVWRQCFTEISFHPLFLDFFQGELGFEGQQATDAQSLSGNELLWTLAGVSPEVSRTCSSHHPSAKSENLRLGSTSCAFEVKQMNILRLYMTICVVFEYHVRILDIDTIVSLIYQTSNQDHGDSWQTSSIKSWFTSNWTIENTHLTVRPLNTNTQGTLLVLQRNNKCNSKIFQECMQAARAMAWLTSGTKLTYIMDNV